ncbi:MAG: thiamine-phosphate kinase [Acidiferrobacteraceae bacterium]
MTGEFDLIRRYFRGAGPVRDDVVTGIGDDCAILAPPLGMELAVSTDTLVEGVHFPEGTHPSDLGYKALAVNLSDLAAAGADPAWFLLNLTLPKMDAEWLSGFSEGLFQLARDCRIALVGGDTTRGPLSVTITVHGFVPQGGAIRRRGARPGDIVYVTGFLGQAMLGLKCWRREIDLPEEFLPEAMGRFLRPAPRIDEARALRGLASAGIDLSDGLAADLGHLLEESEVGARIWLERLPVSPAYDSVFGSMGWDPALAGGDDYELCFTLPPERRRAFHGRFVSFNCGFTEIGEIEAEPGLRLVGAGGSPYALARPGYDHFAGS